MRMYIRHATSQAGLFHQTVCQHLYTGSRQEHLQKHEVESWELTQKLQLQLAGNVAHPGPLQSCPLMLQEEAWILWR